MLEKRVKDLYFTWLVSIIDDGDTDEFDLLLRYLFDREFTWILDFDSNRAAYGLELRNIFIVENDYGDRMKKYMPDGPCSVLEMMIGLALSAEKVVGDHKAWFWFMIKNLGLKDCRDDVYSQTAVKRKIDIFLNRTFRPDGKGGLFYIKNSENDLREIEIWYQLMFYINSIYDEV